MPTFSKRHYEVLAQTIQDVRMQYSYTPAIDELVEALCFRFMDDNKSFHPDRFRRACVPGANVRARS